MVNLREIVMIQDLKRQGLGIVAIARQTVRKYLDRGLQPAHVVEAAAGSKPYGSRFDGEPNRKLFVRRLLETAAEAGVERFLEGCAGVVHAIMQLGGKVIVEGDCCSHRTTNGRLRRTMLSD